MLARLAELLRATLEHGSDPEVPLEKELELLSTYLAIERIHRRCRPRLALGLRRSDGHILRSKHVACSIQTRSTPPDSASSTECRTSIGQCTLLSAS
jgi:hypothetical protein